MTVPSPDPSREYASREYGRAGLIGIGTPQANPTVEAEMRILLPPTMMPLCVRLASRAASPAERLCAYLRELPETLERFDVLRPDVFGFGCTGSSYLVPRDEARRIVAGAEDRFGFPIVLAADAMAARLDTLGARRIALISPYPAALAEAAAAYWTAAGIEIAATARVEIGTSDTRAIYGLCSADATRALDKMTAGKLDAIVLSGTGMPTLSLVGERAGVPVLSSNLCLAQRLIELASGPLPEGDDWRTRLAAARGDATNDGKETR